MAGENSAAHPCVRACRVVTANTLLQFTATPPPSPGVLGIGSAPLKIGFGNGQVTLSQVYATATITLIGPNVTAASSPGADGTSVLTITGTNFGPLGTALLLPTITTSGGMTIGQCTKANGRSRCRGSFGRPARAPALKVMHNSCSYGCQHPDPVHCPSTEPRRLHQQQGPQCCHVPGSSLQRPVGWDPVHGELLHFGRGLSRAMPDSSLSSICRI